MKTIAILSGGNSSEFDISVKSAIAVRNALAANYRTYIIMIRGIDWFWEDESRRIFQVDLNTLTLSLNNESVRFDAVFIAIHGTPGENGLVQGYLDMMGVPYTSCSTYTSALTFNKAASKSFLKDFDIPMAESLTFRSDNIPAIKELAETIGLPMFIKPNESGSSFGVTMVEEQDDIGPAIEEAFKESTDVMAEAYMQGTEVACGVLETKSRTIQLPVTEIVSKNKFFDYEAKYTPGVADEITPARIPGSLEQEVKDLSLKIYRLLDCKGLVRVDFIIVDNKPMFLELNSIPGMTDESIIPKQIIESGMTPGELYSMIIEDLF